MELYSIAFIGFVLISVLIHEIAGKHFAGRQWMVRLAASAAFYVFIAGWHSVFLLVSILTVWYGGMKLERGKKSVLWILLCVNIGILLVAKYILPATGHPILLPLGISYYTLMAVSYTVDVYGQKYPCEKNPAKLALYLSWFPQMLQGPINRYDTLSPTLYGDHRISGEALRRSALLFMFGAFKKFAIANVMIGTVGEIYGGDLGQKPGGFLFFGAVLFALCQYADFSGGIDMMFAASRLFGVEMDINFSQPYFAKSIAEFWRRWHITLGSFMKDYVFFPFAVSRPIIKLNKKLGKKYGNHIARSVVGGIGNILVFFLVGLWHGPYVHFVLWGLFNGVIIAVSDLCEPLFARMRSFCHIPKSGGVWDLLRIVRTFVIICLAGYFDYIEAPANSFIAFKNTFLHFGPNLSRLWVIDLFNANILSTQKVTAFLISVFIVFIVDVMREKKIDPAAFLLKRPAITRWPILYVIMILILMSFTLVENNAGFMYAAF